MIEHLVIFSTLFGFDHRSRAYKDEHQHGQQYQYHLRNLGLQLATAKPGGGPTWQLTTIRWTGARVTTGPRFAFCCPVPTTTTPGRRTGVRTSSAATVSQN